MDEEDATTMLSILLETGLVVPQEFPGEDSKFNLSQRTVKRICNNSWNESRVSERRKIGPQIFVSNG
jgi:hypothetical protein